MCKLPLYQFRLPVTLVMTAVGHDKPGLIEAVSRLVLGHVGNWL